MNDRNLHFSSTLHLKFILVYIIFGFLAAFIAAMLVPGFIYDQLINSAADDLYKSANIIAIRYLPSYFTDFPVGRADSAKWNRSLYRSRRMVYRYGGTPSVQQSSGGLPSLSDFY